MESAHEIILYTTFERILEISTDGIQIIFATKFQLKKEQNASKLHINLRLVAFDTKFIVSKKMREIM